MADKKEIDEVSGVETTGHEWDGIKDSEQPAAALVAVDLLCLHHLGLGLYRVLSGLAGYHGRDGRYPRLVQPVANSPRR